MDKPTKNEPQFRPDPNRCHPPIDKRIKLPRQVLHAVARAEDLHAGKPPRSARVTAARTKTGAEAKIPHSDAEIEAALERWDQGKLVVTDPDFSIIIELARHGARMIKANRQGARRARKASPAVTKRLQYLIQAFTELGPTSKAHHTGQKTIERLRKSVLQKLGVPDSDKAVPEGTIIKDIQMVRPLLGLIQKGILPAPRRGEGEQERSEKTRQEIEAGRAALRKAAARTTKPPRKSARTRKPRAPRKSAKGPPHDF